jgi:hypothetical protein
MLGLLLAAAVATAATAPSPPPATKSADPLVCHNEPIEGSRITHRICMRASQIAERRLDARWLLDRAQSASPP